MSDIKVINDIRKKIERERNIVNSSTKIRETTSNLAVKQRCNSNIREAQQNLEYLTKTLEGLTLKSVSSKDSQSTSGTLVSGQSEAPNKHYNTPNFTRLDLIKYDCPSLGHRIQYMLQLLEFKLQIENQYREASEKMIRLYQFDSDKHSSSAALGGRIESNKKIPLLTRALKRYRDMHIDIADVKEETELLSNQRLRGKPLTGVITIGIKNLKDIDHIISNSLTGKKSESVILIKVDDEIKVRTKPFRNGKLSEHLQFQINVDKNNELEISVCDKVNGDQLVPVAVVWFQIGDIVEELRRKRKYYENSNNGWVSASNLTSQPGPGFQQQQHQRVPLGNPGVPPGASNNFDGSRSDMPVNNNNSPATTPAPHDITSTFWYILEPSGQILLTFGFVKTDHSSGNRYGENNLGGLGRHGAIRERKDNVYEQHGHHFVHKNFYNIMMCAYCGEFARYSCYQCEDCRYLCHRKCYKNVVTKCISKSSTDIDPDEAKLNHKIPHRFEPVTNRGTKWCCHCGFILPWGKKNVRKCSECGVMCHAQCAHLVPDFCGMSMIMANKVLTEIRKSGKTGSPVKTSHSSGPSVNQLHHHHYQQQQHITGSQFNERPSFDEYSSSPISSKFPSSVSNDHNAVGKNSYNNQYDQDFDNVRESPLSHPASQPEYHAHTHPYSTGIFPQKQPPSSYGGSNSVDSDYSNEHYKVGSNNNLHLIENAIPQIVVESDYDKTSQFEKDRVDQVSDSLALGAAAGVGAAGQYADSVFSKEVPNPFESDEQRSQAGAESIVEVSGKESPTKVSGYFNDYSNDNVEKRISKIDVDGAFTQINVKQEVPTDSAAAAATTTFDGMRVEPISLDPTKHQLQQELDEEQRQQHKTNFAQSAGHHKSHKKEKRRHKVGLDDFQFLAVLGKGNFGKVMLAESRVGKKLCAIKVLKKDFIIENDEVESTKSEKRVFLIANKKRHPFLINLHCCFQTANRIYFVMEYVSGGDLMWHIQKARFSQRRAQFYAAEVLLGLKYFHDNGVIYRDLKLDNILLTTEGHIKIADYGLCKEEMWYGNTTSTFCGTPEFMAPEILKEQKYGKAVDWWAFGVLLYQMLLGQSPFRGGDEEEIFNAILTDEPLYPIQMARESVEVLQALLTRDPTRRLGAGPRDAEEVMEHPYFRNINFDDVVNLRIPPPYLPEVKSEHDVSNFDDEFTAETPRLTPVNSTLDSSMQEKFRGFSHMSDEFI